MCKTVINNVLLPLVARYGESVGLWHEHYRGHGLGIEDEHFADFLGEEFHADFNLGRNHCAHMRDAITRLEKEKPEELNVWIDGKLRKYVRLKTAIRRRAEPRAEEEVIA